MNFWILTLAITFFLLMFIVVPLVVARYIYQDAQNRELEGPLWYALLAFFVPFYLGIAFYMFKVDAIESRAKDHHGDL
jgi:hypothetical protein